MSLWFTATPTPLTLFVEAQESCNRHVESIYSLYGSRHVVVVVLVATLRVTDSLSDAETEASQPSISVVPVSQAAPMTASPKHSRHSCWMPNYLTQT